MRRIAAVLLLAAGLVGFSTLAPVPGGPEKASAATTDTGLTIQPVFSNTLIGDFTQGGNTLLQCVGPSTRTAGDDVSGVPPAPTAEAAPSAFTPEPYGCGRDINLALDGTYASQGVPSYNDQINTEFVDRDSNPATTASSSVTVTIPPGATVAYAELEWAGSAYGTAQNGPGFVPNPTIFTEPMDVSIGDDQHYVSVTPDQGATATPGNPAVNTGAYYYSASANITSEFQASGHTTGAVTVWGADAPFYTDGFQRAGLGWHVVVVYQYPAVDQTANPPQVFKQITLQTGLIYQQPTQPDAQAPTNTVIDVPPISNPNNTTVGVMGVEGDSRIQGDTFSIDGHNLTHPVTGQTNNFWVSFAQNATDPNWTNNMSIDDVSFTLPPGTVAQGDTSMTLTTNSVANATGQDTFGLTGMNTAAEVLEPHFTVSKTVNQTAFVVGQPITYDVTVTNDGSTDGTATLADTVPATVTVSDFSCSPTGGASCTANHTGSVLSGTISAPVGGSVVFTVTGTVVATGSASNTATVTVTTPNCGVECGGGPATADATVLTASLRLVKAADPTTVSAAGQSVSYTFTVTNTGEAGIASLVVDDIARAPAGRGAPPTCDATTLAPSGFPGDSTVCHSAYPASAADIAHGDIFDTATASGTATAVSAGPPVTVTSNPFSASVDVQPPQPGFTAIVVNTANTLTLSP